MYFVVLESQTGGQHWHARIAASLRVFDRTELVSHMPVCGQLTDVDGSVATRVFPGTNPRGELEQCRPGRGAVRSLQSRVSSE